MMVSLNSLIFTALLTIFVMGAGFACGWSLGRQDLEIKQARERDDEWDREHGIR